jgi:hypothetical protein
MDSYLNQSSNTEESYGIELTGVSANCENVNILRFFAAAEKGGALSCSATALFVSKPLHNQIP